MKSYSKGNRTVLIEKKNNKLVISFLIMGIMILQHFETSMSSLEFQNIMDFINK